MKQKRLCTRDAVYGFPESFHLLLFLANGYKVFPFIYCSLTYPVNFTPLNLFYGVGKMALWLKTLAALSEDPGLILSSHMTAHNCQQLQFQET